MTPCSAACVGRFSSRESSRSTCLRTSSGRSSSASCSRSSLASAADSSNSPSSSWIALSCWRRTNSRCVRSISDCTWLWISEPIEMTSSSRASTSVSRRRRSATFDSSSSACFSSVGRRSDPEMRWLSPLASSTFATAICSSSGRYGTASTICENVCCTLRMSAVSSSDSSTTSGSSEISAVRYGVSLVHVSIRTRWAPWTSRRKVPSGTLSIRATTPTTPTS